MITSSSSSHTTFVRPFRKHTVPTHLYQPETVLTVWSFNLTSRQLLLVLLGCGLAGNLWHDAALLGRYSLVGEALRLVLAALPILLAVFVAYYRAAGRPLEVWLIVLLRYWFHPHCYIWHSIRYSEQQLYPASPAYDGDAIGGEKMRQPVPLAKEIPQ
jgi:hypothetical protein